MSTNTNKPENIRKSESYFLIAFALINLFAFCLILGSITFLTGHTLSAWQFPVALILALFVNFRLIKILYKDQAASFFGRNGIIVVAIVLVSVFLAGLFYDVSFDGQSYHMESVYQLGKTWNPITTELPDSVNRTEIDYVNHYPKGAEVPQAAIYAITNRIEYGKATNLMLFAACFFLCLSFLYRIDKFSFKKKMFISALFVLNPVMVGELISYYVDGQLAALALCFLVVSAFIFIEAKRYYLFLLSSIIIVTVNLKFTGIPFILIFVFGLLVLLLLNKKMQQFKQVIIGSALAGVVGVVLAGYHPYVVNTVNYHHPFYPVMGNTKKDIIGLVYPESFKYKNRFGKFFTSFFSHTDELKIYLDKDPKVPFKIPFTLNKTDLKNAPKLGVKMAGFGPFFSGAVLISLVLLLLVWKRLSDKQWRINMVVILGTLLLSVFSVSEAWWARFVPQLWLFPLIIAYASETSNIKSEKWLRGIVYVSLGLNICLSLLIIPWNVYKTAEAGYQMDVLKASKDTIKIEMSYFRSNRIRFYEHDIPIKEQHVDGPHVDSVIHSSTKFEVPANIPPVEMPALLKWIDAVKKKVH
ncbi:MAG: hypothetical protein JST75_10810 [Bacteroidetes bacterium]|nr:hypothetical protein [Bacteroidota bacterium]